MNKLINLLRFDRDLLITPNISLINRISFIIRKYYAVAFNKRRISYLGRKFIYDGKFSPVAMQMYPLEISFLDKKINFKKIRSILDIGSNIGQFSFTIKSFYPQISCYCFEPNSKIFPLLEKNTSYFSNMHLFNYGIGKKEKRAFYFAPSSSGLGSFYEKNVHQFGNKKDVEEIQIKCIELSKKTLKNLNLPKNFDLIKIDVEGAEIEVLKSLKNVDCKYLFIEISVNREGKTEIEGIKKIIRQYLKKNPILLASKRLSNKSPSIDCLFKLENLTLNNFKYKSY